jgi:hypothetical protein
MVDLKKLVMLIVVLINIIIFNFIYKLEKNKCLCSKGYKREFIKYYALLTIFIGIIFIIGALKILPSPVLNLLSTIYSVLGLLNVYLLFTLTQGLVIKKCTCSNSWDRKFVYYYSMIIMSGYIILITIIIFKSLFRKEMEKLKI